MRHGLTVVPATGLLALLLAPAGARVWAAEPAPTPTPVPPPLSVPDDRLGIRTAPLLLLSRADVRADVGLNARQAEAAARAAADLRTRAAATRGLSGQQALAARRAVDEAERAWLAANLSEPQRVRLLQLGLQWEGPAALLTRPVVAETLALTPGQRAALSKALAERNAARARSADPLADERTFAGKALSALSDSQKHRWRSMLGRPFTPQIAAARTGGAPAR